ncbi:MAG: histidine phosphatase family protein [Candidatus Uhrbacteria bacterium]|nr:histidine phosphatase family protein [Candidatus Uhrbacteria bacterium]
MKTKLIFVRHGISEAKDKGIVQGQGLLIPMTPEGHKQAAILAETLKPLNFTAIFSSQAKRVMETAEAIRQYHHEIPYQELAEFNERSKGEAEGITQEEFRARYPDMMAAWAKEIDARPVGGENYEDVHDRVVPMIEQHVQEYDPGSTLLYVGHGNVFRVILGHMLDIPFRYRSRIVQDYCAINVVEYDHEKKRWRIVCINRPPDAKAAL